MKKDKSKYLRFLTYDNFKIVGITILGFLFSLFFRTPLTLSIQSLMSVTQDDFKIVDLYSKIADSNPEKTLDNNITIVDIRDKTRNEIADAIYLISELSPAAVGVDIIISESTDTSNNEYFVNIAEAYPKDVYPLKVIRKENDLFTISGESFFMDKIDSLSRGIVTLPSISEGGIKREYRVSFPVCGGDTIDSFAAAVAEQASPDTYLILKKRGNKTEYINFLRKEFRIIDGSVESIISNEELIKSKIVLIGSVNDGSDRHKTSVNPNMSGILVHAYAISNIIDADYFTEPSTWVSILVAVIASLFIVYLSVKIKHKGKAFILRSVQLLFLFLSLIFGYFLFLQWNVVFDVSYIVLIVLFTLLASDFWSGGEYLYEKWIEKKTRNRKQIKSH